MRNLRRRTGIIALGLFCMTPEPAKLLDYQARHRHERIPVWRQVVFYALGIIGLLVVLFAIFIALYAVGERHGMW